MSARMAAAGLLLASTAVTAQVLDARQDLIASHKCLYSSLLAMTYNNPGETSDEARFFTISVRKKPDAYVRCRFAPDRPTLHCEASPAYYEEDNEHPLYVFMPPNRTAALTRLGFTPSPPLGNLHYAADLKRPPDFDAVATLMLTALHDGYGVRAETELDIGASFKGTVVTACRSPW